MVAGLPPRFDQAFETTVMLVEMQSRNVFRCQTLSLTSCRTGSQLPGCHPDDRNVMYAMDEEAPERITGPRLSGREVEVLRTWLICETKEAAGRVLFISPATVSTHIVRIRDKYEAAGRPANTKATLLARALQDGMITVDEL